MWMERAGRDEGTAEHEESVGYEDQQGGREPKMVELTTRTGWRSLGQL